MTDRKRVRKSNSRDWKKYKKYIPFFIFLLCVGMIIYFFFLSPVFRVSAISVSGTRYVREQEIKAAVHGLLTENIFFASIPRKAILTQFPLIQTISLQKQFPNHVAIVVQEYPPDILLQTPAVTDVLSKNAIVVDKVKNNSTTYKLPLVITSEESIAAVPLADLILFVNTIENDKKGFIASFHLVPPYDLTASYEDGHTVTFSLHKDLPEQMKQMQGVRNYLGFSKCRKLDVRFTNIYCSG